MLRKPVMVTCLACFFAVVAVFTVARVSFAADPREDGDSEKAIRKVLDDQVAAWNKGDLAGFMGGYWNSPQMTFSSGGTTIQGWQGAFDRYKARYQAEGQEMGKLAFVGLDVNVLSPEAAFVRGGFQLKTSKDSPKGIFTLIFKKFPEGWKIVHDHTSAAN